MFINFIEFIKLKINKKVINKNIYIIFIIRFNRKLIFLLLTFIL